MERWPILRSSVICALLLTAFPARSNAQDKPDFSGFWVLEPGTQSAADIPLVLSVSLSVRRTNVYGEPMTPFFKDITVTRVLEDGSPSVTHEIGVVGGTVGGVVDGTTRGPRSFFGVTWEGDALVFVNGSHTGPTEESGVWNYRREVWTLESDGRLRLTITARSSVEPSTALFLFYRRM